jgi:hypothetical protein
LHAVLVRVIPYCFGVALYSAAGVTTDSVEKFVMLHRQLSSCAAAAAAAVSAVM